MRYSEQYLHEDKKYSKRLGLSSYFVIAAVSFGVLLILLNVYQLYHVTSKAFGDSPFLSNNVNGQKAAWIYAKKSNHLKHVIRILIKSGYSVVTSLTPPPRWDLMWAYDFPFRKEFLDTLTNLQYDQKVNHLPGTASITLKVELARTKLRWIPQAFSIPNEKDQFNLMVERSPDKLWVQKSNNHRGIKIVGGTEVDIEAKGTFVQEFIEHPLLIDGKKFDIGVYVVYTSVNPLQVYIYNDDMLVRFCTEDYHPLDVQKVDKYVVGDRYISLADMPSLKMYYQQGKMSFKDALFTHIAQIGYDTTQMWNDVQNCIREMFLAKAEAMDERFGKYHSKHNFFELVRIDFVIDDSGKVWLMEVNMSPNLSSDTHPGNAIMYQQVVMYTLAMVGVASHLDQRYDVDIKEVISNDRDITLPNSQCKSAQCLNSCASETCILCHHCFTDELRMYLKKAFREHQNKGCFHRVLPVPLRASDGDPIHANSEPTHGLDKILGLWFKAKCKLDASWCQ